MPSSQRDLTNLYISESYYRLLQTDPTDDSTLLDGTGSLVTYLAVSGTVDAFSFKGDGSQLSNVNLSGSNTFTSSQQVIDSLRGKTVEVDTLVAQQYVVSSSVYYVTQSWSSGSTIFGNTADDTHQFTGSVFIEGPLTVSSGITGSVTTASYIDPLYISASAAQYGFSSPVLSWDNIQSKPENIISGSGQRSVLGLGVSDNVVFGDISGSNGIFGGNVFVGGTLTAQTYVVSSSIIDIQSIKASGSTQFGDTIDDTHQFTGSLLLSGSLYGVDIISASNFIGTFQGALSSSQQLIQLGFVTNATLSGSLDWDLITDIPPGLVSSSAQTLAHLEGTNIVSGSDQRSVLGLGESDSPRFSTIYATNGNLDGNLVVGGTITARTYVISSSVVNYETLTVSGSTKFGNSPDDTHEFTGSILTDSVIINTNEINYGPPNLAGTTDRITLWDNSTNPNAYNYAIGIEGNHLWNAVDVNDPDWGFKWYAGGVEVAHLDGVGTLFLSSSLTASQVVATGITGSLEGTASWSTNAVTASYALYTAGFNSGSFATTGSNIFFGNQTVNGDMTVTGILTAQEFHTEIISSSTLYESGSTKFGDTLDDTHQFTGSLYVTGALVIPTVQTLSPTADVGSIVINNNSLYIYF